MLFRVHVFGVLDGFVFALTRNSGEPMAERKKEARGNRESER